MTARITDNGRDVLDGMLEQMEEMANELGPVAVDAYRTARRSLEVEWVAAETVVDDAVNGCNRSIHAFVTEADFVIRDFENKLTRSQDFKEREKE